jgi:hypothetical protein
MKVTPPLLGLLVALSTSAAFAGASITTPAPSHTSPSVAHTTAIVAHPKPVIAHVTTAPVRAAASVTRPMPATHAAVAPPAPRRQQAGLLPSPKAATSRRHIVATTTSTGKAVRYDCSKAGNKTKTACKG